MNNIKNYKLNLVKDEYDERDFQFKAKQDIEIKKLPKEVFIPVKPAEDQQSLGSCTAYSLLGLIEEYYNNEINLSKLFQYYNSRKEDNTIQEDLGTSLRNALKTYNKYGCCLTEFCPYDISKFTIEPNSICYNDGKKRRKITYYRVNSLQEYKASLANGDLVYAGIKIYDSFYETGKDGIVPPLSGNFNGLHAVFSHGYSDKEENGVWKNSWNKKWGWNEGSFKIAYNLFDSIFVDMWSVSMTDEIIGDLGEST